MFYETLALLSVLVQISPVSTNVLSVRPIFSLVDSQLMKRCKSNFEILQIFEIETFDNFNDPFEFVVSETLDIDFERSGIISIACQRDWGRIVTYNKSEVPKFWDSFAKTGTGLIEGRITYLGQPEQCTNVKSGVMPVEVEDFPDTKPFLVAFNQNPTDEFVFTVGVCLPAECSTSDAMIIFQRLVNSTKQNPPSVVSAMEQPDIETSSAGFIVAWVTYSILLILVLVGTLLGMSREALECYQSCKILEETQNLSMVSNNENTAGLNWNEKLNVDVSNNVSNKNDENPSFWIRFFLCFDFHNNMKKILAIPTKTDSSQLQVLNGIRVMSMAWVVLGHTTLLELAVFDNVVYALDKSTSLLFQTLTNASPSVDTFFVLSGLLVMLGALRSLEKLHNPYNLNFWAMFYIHRLARLWPTMILGILFLFGFVPLMSKLTYSPAYQPYAPGSLIDSCKGVNDWASTVFFYNNFVTTGASASLPCIDWTWYVASDMQFYILSPLVIIVVYKWRQVGSGVIGLLIFCSSLITLMMTAIKNIPPAGGSPLIGDPTAQAHYSSDLHWKDIIYFSSYCRFQTYGVGLLLGMALYDLKKVESLIERLSLHLRIVLITSLWLLAVLLGIITIYGVYPTVNGHPMDRVASAFYNGTFRLLWTVAVSLVILLCSLGYGGIVNKFLSSNFWIPFARINYTTYIWHLFWLDVRIMAVEKFFRYSTIQFVLEASGCLALIFCSSVPIAAIVETPFINLQKLLLRRN